MRRAHWVHPDSNEIFKFLPHNPPARGDIVLVDGQRCRVLRCRLEWQGREWQMKGRGVKVKPDPLRPATTEEGRDV